MIKKKSCAVVGVDEEEIFLENVKINKQFVNFYFSSNSLSRRHRRVFDFDKSVKWCVKIEIHLQTKSEKAKKTKVNWKLISYFPMWQENFFRRLTDTFVYLFSTPTREKKVPFQGSHG